MALKKEEYRLIYDSIEKSSFQFNYLTRRRLIRVLIYFKVQNDNFASKLITNLNLKVQTDCLVLN